MSRSVKIPDRYHPMTVKVNNTIYTYMGGSTVVVPDSVADIIDNIIRNEPKEAPRAGKNGQVWTRTQEGSAWMDIPPVASATKTSIGAVKMAAKVSDTDTGEDATAAKCATTINALIATLIASGVLETNVTK